MANNTKGRRPKSKYMAGNRLADGKKRKRKPRMANDEELLTELATLDEAAAYIPTGVDHDAGVVPTWCELVLELRRSDTEFPLNSRLPLRRHDGELIMEVLYSVLHPMGDRSVTKMLENELDEVIKRLMEGTSESRKVDRGMAAGLTRALAILTNPLAYDEDAVRDAAMERYEARH